MHAYIAFVEARILNRIICYSLCYSTLHWQLPNRMTQCLVLQQPDFPWKQNKLSVNIIELISELFLLLIYSLTPVSISDAASQRQWSVTVQEIKPGANPMITVRPNSIYQLQN